MPRPTRRSSAKAGWSDNFYDILSKHPIHVDPLDAFAGTWMFFLSRIKGPIWNPDYGYEHLQPEIDRYGIIPGTGSDAHFAPDYRIGLELGWGGPLEKIEGCRATNSASAAMYDAETKTIHAIRLWMRHTSDCIRELLAEEKKPQLRDDLADMLNHGSLEKGRANGAVTALANVIADIQPGYGNTAPVQLELDPKIACDDESIRKIAALIRGMFERGATLLNINLLDEKKILTAHKNPALHPVSSCA